MFESIKALENKNSILFKLDFVNNTILSCFLFFSIIDLYFLIHAVSSLIFNPFTKLVLPIGIPSKEVKAGIEIHPIIVEDKRRGQYNLEL